MWWICIESLFCGVVLGVLSSSAIILSMKLPQTVPRDLIKATTFYLMIKSGYFNLICCDWVALCLLLMVSWIVLLSVIVAFLWSYILLPYWNGTVFAILNFHIAQISPSLSPIQHSVDIIRRFC